MERELSKLQESCLTFAKVLLAAGVVWKDTTSYSRDSKEKYQLVLVQMLVNVE
jgi:energy-converting hydrogenase Eha subunit H